MPLKAEYTVEEGQGGVRADAFLAQVSGLSRSQVSRLMEAGRVLREGRPVRKNEKLSPGAAVTVELPETEPLEVKPQDIPLDVVYEDGDVVVVNKPRGMVVHPAPGHPDGTLVNALLFHCGTSLSGINGVARPGIVHRIDQFTSGLLVAAKNDLAHAALAEQIAAHEAARVYEAVVWGGSREDRGTVDAPIGRHRTDRKRMAVTPGGREAVTHYEVLARYPGFTHLRCILETGRTHQIRVHMSHIGHPVLGDPVYGPRRDPFHLGGQCLHARTLKFRHPRTGEAMEFTTDLPEYFLEVLRKLEGRERQERS